MRDCKIGILALQETHLTQTDIEFFKRNFNDKLIIVNSADRFSPNARGVALVINRHIIHIKANNLIPHEIVASRALQVNILWHNNETTLNFLAVYAPNSPQQNEVF
jgi:exonuclease III